MKAKIKDWLAVLLLFSRIGIQIFGMYVIYKCFTSFTNHTLSDCKALGNVIKCYVIEWICIIGLGGLILAIILILIIKNKWKFWCKQLSNKYFNYFWNFSILNLLFLNYKYGICL